MHENLKEMLDHSPRSSGAYERDMNIHEAELLGAAPCGDMCKGSEIYKLLSSLRKGGVLKYWYKQKLHT